MTPTVLHFRHASFPSRRRARSRAAGGSVLRAAAPTERRRRRRRRSWDSARRCFRPSDAIPDRRSEAAARRRERDVALIHSARTISASAGCLYPCLPG